ncbi:hypothetical protein [Nocardioides sp. Kera G14]|uniref:hypothetical protein n=1 Tax=Nocardioides sp. Kera G14 TaxID=2884264 RepID=UPI001D0FEE11|nr:hypothetical protein [Nocardioides sp. Kera G14]UDY23365.1 hypothetical protein LH076_15075 [Nocardioides sp. Kera G14]
MATVFLHVGAPKTGTTYLQDRLARNRASLARHGVKYPIGMRDSMFLPAVDLTGIKWPGFHEQASGEWKALVRRINVARGTVIVSHEVFAVTKPSRIAMAMEDLAGHDVHVIFTAREPGRQLAADWQEGLKTYNSRTFDRFLNRIVEADPMTSRLWFWRAQHLPRALANWSAVLPPEKVHLLTVPQGPSDTLWLRFCGLTGIDPAWAPEEATKVNQSLGIAGAQTLRRLNAALFKAGVNAEEHRDLVFNTIVPRLLEVIEDPAPISTPPALDAWVENLAEEWIHWAKSAAIDVVGDLEELRPLARTGEWQDPDDVQLRRVLRLMTTATVAAVQEATSRPEPAGRLPARVMRAGRRLLRRPEPVD